MQTVAPHADYADDEPLLPLHETARRSLVILCVVYLVLGLIDAVAFMSTGLGDLRDRAAEAAVALAAVPEAADVLRTEATRQLGEAQLAVRRGWIRIGGIGVGLAMVAYVLFVHRRRVKTRSEVVSAATMMIVLLGLALLASRLVVQSVIPNLAFRGLADLFALHVLACLILPWRPRESVLPFALLLLVWAVTFLVPHATDLVMLDRVVGVIISPVILVPGVLIANWRWRRREEDAERLILGEQVRSIGGELSRARIVHDAMFPRSFDSGHVCFKYDYQPIAEIGGDYVHVHTCTGSGRITITILDVAGHGLAAALTVNRLFGELERIRAEDPDAEPGHVMELLNRYINLTMAAHSLYATGLCVALDPATGDIKWVNAGHPPALLRKAKGDVLELDGTTMLLGAQTFAEFEPNQQSARIDPGDVIIAYTDGAFEARDPQGERFGLDRLRLTARFNPPPRDWTKFITNAVSQHHGGHAEDDVLVAALHLRSLRIGELFHDAENEVELETSTKA